MKSLWLHFLMAQLLLAGCGARNNTPAGAAASAIEDVTAAHTRVVWVQDTTELTDVFAQRDQLRLMALDTRDRQGERVLLAGPGNFTMPMITPDGRRVVYTDRLEPAVYVVDWEGGTPRKLLDGIALEVWDDQDTGITWIYVGTDPTPPGNAYHTIRRHRLDNPSVHETVWKDNVPVGENNFQLSADGRIASGMFPWPECGIAHLEEQRFERLGNGCWTALAPDNSYLFWLFDGAHRNLTLVNTRNSERWTINVSQAPGIGGHEAYHPRWSNHPRFMTLTGPYKIRSGGNNIRGGGDGVEIHIGRFSEDFQRVETWVQVTSNTWANFFPDVWVNPDETSLSRAPDPAVQALRDMTGARTRVLWVRDIGDGTDYLAKGKQSALVGLDTDDGKGARVLLPGPRNIAKPMFTLDGDRILFSDRHTGRMSLLHWEGGEPQDLGEGFALTTWRDPELGVEWLYYAKELIPDNKVLPNYEGMYRKALPPYPDGARAWIDRVRGKYDERRNWGQTAVSEDSYQLSADGRFASAPFPWPEVGVHDVIARRWVRHGRGCWVGMAPDNSYFFWIFDGPHRNLVLEKVGGDASGRWVVPVNALPGHTQRYEVYHPRWSNHPRILAVTGPYTKGEGAFRLPGGGPDVEIHVGRFSEDYRAVEQWVQLTEDEFANFYPDVWVEPDGDGFAEGAPVALQPTVKEETWPVSEEDLIFVWKSGAAQNEIEQGHTGKRRLFRPEPSGHARLGHRHAMWLDHGYFAEDDAPISVKEFTMEFLLTLPERSSDRWIMGYGPDWALRLRGERLEWILGEENVLLGELPRDREFYVSVAHADSSVSLYINGEEQSRIPLTTSMSLPKSEVLYWGGFEGNISKNAFLLEHIALYGRALRDIEIKTNAALALDYVRNNPSPEPWNVRARVVEASSIPSPEDIAPYRRGLVVNEYEIIEGDRAGERLLAAHWAILDANVLDSAQRTVGEEYDLSLILFEERPELEGERLSMDSENFLLEQYYDLNL